MSPVNVADPLLCGANAQPNLVAADLVENAGSKGDQMALFFRRDGRTIREMEPFRPFLLLTDTGLLSGYPGTYQAGALQGRGPLSCRVEFPSWKQCWKARTWLGKATGFSSGSPEAPFFFLNDPVQQHLLATGRTLFKGMEFGELRRMQVDIECLTAEGFEFCNAEREEDRIIAIAVADQSGWVEVISGAELAEKEILERFVALVRDRDPDVLEGHNIFNFDLPYLATRAKRHGVKLALGRDGSEPEVRPSRLAVAERVIAYSRFDIFGRHVVDTLFLVQAYDVSHRSLDGYGL
jgi:DNA polymerase, archaea type